VREESRCAGLRLGSRVRAPFLLGLLIGAVSMAGALLRWRADHPGVHPLDTGSADDARLRGTVIEGVLMPQGDSPVLADGPYTWNAFINPQGFRERAELQRSAPMGTRRVLALGDSQMLGYGLNDGVTIPDRLEVALSARLGGTRVEVINAAAFGACAFDLLRRWRRLEREFEFDAVLFSRPGNRHREEGLQEVRKAWHHAATWRAPPSFYLPLERLLLRWLPPPAPPAPAVTVPYDDAELYDIQVLADEARTRGIDTWMLELPANVDSARSGTGEGEARWHQALAPLGVRFVGHRVESRTCWGFVDRAHLSEAGANAVAIAIADTMAAGRSESAWPATPRCEDVEGAGPGKSGWPTGEP